MALRQQLDDEWTVFGTEVVVQRVAPDGTDKLLLGCRDGRRVECVLMAEEDRRTVCISTQVGCGMGCVFCASGLKGVERNLTRVTIIVAVLFFLNTILLFRLLKDIPLPPKQGLLFLRLLATAFTAVALLRVPAVASPARPTSLAVSAVRRDAVSALRAISCVAAPCSVTAAAMVAVISPTSRMVRWMLAMASTERTVACCMPLICAEISSVALAVWPASD